IHHVRAHRDAVPRTFAEAIPLAAHQKAADYTVAKARLGMIDVLLGAAVLLALTLGGLIDRLSAQWARVFDPQGLWHGAALFATFIAPLFNRFTKLEDPSLAGRIEALLRRCGFRASGLYVMDGSKRSSHGNAYFTGFGAAKRIVLFDTLLSRLAPPEVEAVL